LIVLETFEEDRAGAAREGGGRQQGRWCVSGLSAGKPAGPLSRPARDRTHTGPAIFALLDATVCWMIRWWCGGALPAAVLASRQQL
jgi:hypothetical protein